VRAWLMASGPSVARLFHRLLGLVFLDAWLSFAVQLRVLIGARGLLPIATLTAHARNQLAFADFPTLLWINASDATLIAGVAIGVALAIAQLFARRPRLLAACQLVLYLSYVTAGRSFFAFQWDNLLLECACFAMFLPRDRRCSWIHILFRLILFKLYWESGLAKFQSATHDWRDGTAMRAYYETAPLPTALAWYAHHLPPAWHHFESWMTLAFELVVPFAIFGPRRARLTAAAIFTLFQIINAATANYGFFCYLATALHVFLLDERDLVRFWTWSRSRLRLSAPAAIAEPLARPSWRMQLGRVTAVIVASTFVGISVIDGLINFADSPRVFEKLGPLRARYDSWRVVNTYHLFGSITTERIEPEFQTFDGASWQAHELWHKPGNPRRRPDWVAPHQPRVDFQLWFYGLNFRIAPQYVETLIVRLCRDPSAVQPLFRDPLPPHPRAARIAFWRYQFTSADERRATGEWWKRTPLGAIEAISCDTEFPDRDAED
jgi:hypothetical protein